MAADAVRVLHVFGTLGLGGAETRTVDLYRHIDRNRVQFDFLVHSEGPDYYDETVTKRGARIYRMSRFTGTNAVSYRGGMERLFREHAGMWRVVQGHMTSTASIYLPLAKRYGAEVTIAHARSAGVEPGIKGIATKLLEHPLRTMKDVDARFAVSRKAGEAVFGKNAFARGRVRVLANAIDTERFAYDPDVRARIRASFRIGPDTALVGHTGRFHYAKNHEYLLRVFAETKRMMEKNAHPAPKLLLVGDGERMEEMRKLAAARGIAEDVLFAGARQDVQALYQAMDAFVYPSRYEGMPGVVIEAQASGLNCLVSDAITTEADVTPLVRRMSLSEDSVAWARETVAALRAERDRAKQSAEAVARLKETGFDVRSQARMMTDFYTGKTDMPV